MVTIDGTGFLVTVGELEVRLQRRDVGFRYGDRSAYVMWGDSPLVGGIFITGRGWSWARNWVGYVEAAGSRKHADTPSLAIEGATL